MFTSSHHESLDIVYILHIAKLITAIVDYDRQSLTMVASSSDRKSDAEFQKILDTFVGDKETVLTGSLPDRK